MATQETRAVVFVSDRTIHHVPLNTIDTNGKRPSRGKVCLTSRGDKLGRHCRRILFHACLWFCEWLENTLQYRDARDRGLRILPANDVLSSC